MLRGVVYMMKSSGPRTEPWGTLQEEGSTFMLPPYLFQVTLISAGQVKDITRGNPWVWLESDLLGGGQMLNQSVQNIDSSIAL